MTVPNEQQPAAQPTPPFAPQNEAPKPTKSWFARHKILTGIGGFLVLIVGINVVNGGGDDDVAASGGDVTATDEAAVESGEDAAVEATADAPAEEKAEGEEPVEEEPVEEAIGIGDSVRDGKFEFTVTGVESGVPSVGDDYLSQEAQGQYVLVAMTVENIGDEAQYFFGDNQDLTDTEGRTHSADGTASIYLDSADSLMTEINPGNTVDGVVVFDIPTDATPAEIELHDSAFSGGVTVALS